jgi:hypothetical protein
MAFTQAKLSQMMENCDERIASVQLRLDKMTTYGKVLGLCSGLYDKAEDKAVFNMKDKEMYKLKNMENNIKLIQVERMIYIALSKPNNAIFPRLRAKYDDYIRISYELSDSMVQTEGIEEQEYLEYCKNSLAQRDYIHKLCHYGEYR